MKEIKDKIQNEIEFEIAIVRLKFRAEYLSERLKLIEEEGEQVEDTVLRYSGMAGRYSAVTRGLAEELKSIHKKLEKVLRFYKKQKDEH